MTNQFPDEMSNSRYSRSFPLHVTHFFLLLFLLLLLSLIPSCSALTRSYELILSERYLAQDGNYNPIKTINGQSPGPTLEADENDWISVKVLNNLQVPASIHFHGILQKGTPWSDGVPGITQHPIAAGDSYTYLFQAKGQYGAFWYHSHFRGYSSDGLYGLIYIRPGPHRQRPYSLIANTSKDLALMYELEKTPSTLIADDNFHYSTDTLFLRMFQHGIDPLCIRSVLVNGKGRVYCHRGKEFRRLASKNPFLMSIPEFDSLGCVKDPSLRTFKGKSIDHVALKAPGYSEPCQMTRSAVHILYTNGRKWQYINVLNAGGQNTKAFSVDDHPFYLVAVDGLFVQPELYHSILIPVGSRCTILMETDPSAHENVTRPFIIRFAVSHTPQYIEGLAFLHYGHEQETKIEEISKEDASGAVILETSNVPDVEISNLQFQDPDMINTSDYQNGVRYQDLDGRLLSASDKSCWPHETVPFEASSMISPNNPADITYKFFLHMFDTVQFTMFANRAQLQPDFETSEPLLNKWYDKKLQRTDESTQSAVLYPSVSLGQTVDLIVNNDKHINHPVHLHGHYMQLLSYSTHENFPFGSLDEAINANCSTLNLKNPPLLDVVLVPVGGHAVLRFVADNPGIWLFHCHNVGHLMGGMGAVLLEALENIPSQ